MTHAPDEHRSTPYEPTDKPPTPEAAISEVKKYGSKQKQFIAIGEIILCSGFPTQLALANILALIGFSAFSGTGTLNLSYVVILSLADTIILIFLIFFFLTRGNEKPKDIFFGARPLAQEINIGLVLIPLTVILAIGSLQLLYILWPSLQGTEENPLEALIDSPLNAMIFVGVAVIAGGLREELQRAFILHRFREQLGKKWLGLFMFSVMFGLGHYIQGWDAVIVTALLGATWGALFLIRKSVVSTIISHAGFNVVEVVIALVAASAT
tara:strand:+ start:464 stop:1267 length:804 start_codon:yes stop_codon:yes gene_type:complete